MEIISPSILLTTDFRRPRKNDADDHGRLKAHLKEGKRRGIALKLDQLRQWRNAADYEDSWTADLATVANTAISEAQRVLDLVAASNETERWPITRIAVCAGRNLTPIH